MLIVGCGGGQVARVANSLARVGLHSDICGPTGVPFLPETSEGYRQWRAVVLGPLPGGAGTFTSAQIRAIAEFVTSGGGIVFVGGMDSFSGANGRGGYDGTPLATVMPVALRPGDDHAFLVEVPRTCADHPILQGLPDAWPTMGERNKQPARKGAQVLVRFRDDPLLVIQEVGEGRSAAFLSSWGWRAQRDFTLWPGFARLWGNLARWVGKVEEEGSPLRLVFRARRGAGFRIAKVGGRPMLATPGGKRFYAHGTSVDHGTLDFIQMTADSGFDFFHVWSEGIGVCARASAVAQKNHVRLAVFVPQVPPFARFHDGTQSGSNIKYDTPWHRVPDFYNSEWQRRFREEVRRLARAIAPYRNVVAILWVTNEPEIYKAWGNWMGPDFCLDTPATLRQMRQAAQAQFRDIAQLNQAWRAADGYQYDFRSWDDFEANALPKLFEDYEDRRLNREAYRWLLDFVRNRWLSDWNATVRRILEEEGLAWPLLSARHNYNSVPDLSLIPWDDLDLCGKNLYTSEDSDAYVYETWDAFRASGLPVLMSEWGVQSERPPLGYVGGDEATRAEQAVIGRVLAGRCPWVVGDVWSNVRDIDYPWGFLSPDGKPKPFVALLGEAASVRPVRHWDPLAPGEYRLSPGLFEAPGVRVRRTEGAPNRKPGVVFLR